jgi:flavodoxin
MRSGSHSNPKLATFGNTENVAKRCQDKTGKESSPVKEWRDG